MPLETMTPQRSASACSTEKPASDRASRAAATANWVKRPMRLDSWRPSRASGSKPFTSAASFTFWAAGS